MTAEGQRASAHTTADSADLTLYTADEAAAILRVTRSWLERQAAARKVPFTMLGGGYRFTARHLAQIVDIFEETVASPETTPSANHTTAPLSNHLPDRPGRTDGLLRPRPNRRHPTTT